MTSPAESAADHADRATATATDYAPQAPVDATPDETPALASVGPEYAATSPGGERSTVNLDGLPAFRSMQGTLPSARFHVKRQMMEIQALMPESWKDGDVSEEDVLADVDKVDELFSKAEAMLLDRAKDRAEMERWLCAQENGEQALMDAFSVMAEQLGN
ncbi:hypothetical protein [Corynebacterium heidelbergense]|uniref:Uncharacterized protein n=1 Tax=Corynebacterium heidelbergense TaxID=2055947 RepID=A0A364VC96_9CORY|nr:hypothetical protein [Corynebacterium heidelbergense]RAV34257.1 hypothetical protein CWC39_04190 [Corynebacterium heidelbergense]WCZ36971.1 hypothetical protein CHEID_07190 [Corynebacterium heidelbergense]